MIWFKWPLTTFHLISSFFTYGSWNYRSCAIFQLTRFLPRLIHVCMVHQLLRLDSACLFLIEAIVINNFLSATPETPGDKKNYEIGWTYITKQEPMIKNKHFHKQLNFYEIVYKRVVWESSIWKINHFRFKTWKHYHLQKLNLISNFSGNGTYQQFRICFNNKGKMFCKMRRHTMHLKVCKLNQPTQNKIDLGNCHLARSEFAIQMFGYLKSCAKKPTSEY